MSAHQIIVDHRPQIIIGQLFDLGDFMRGAEAIEEMQEWHTRFQRGSLGDQGHVMRFLHRAGWHHRPAALAGGHHIRVIPEDGQGMRGHRAGRNVEDRAGQFPGNFEHVGDHQQQALAGGEGGGQRAGLECSMHCAGCTALRLHFDHQGDSSPDILALDCRPIISKLTHIG